MPVDSAAADPAEQVVRVGFDVGALRSPLTGIGQAVKAMHHGLANRGGVRLVPYVLSFRARDTGGARRLPIPAGMAHRAWARGGVPSADRWLGDVAVVHGTNYVVPPSRAARLVSVYDVWFLRQPDLASAVVRRAGEVLRRSIDTGAHVHACSTATAEAVHDLFPSATVHTIPLGPIPLISASTRDPLPQLGGAPYVLFVGTLERRKNVPRLVHAFGRMAAGRSDIGLVLAGGDGDDRGAVDDAILGLPAEVARRVVITGRVDEAQHATLMRRAAVLAYPSLDEGFGFPLLDAMQAGVPIVASNVGSIPEVAGGGALLSDPADIDALAGHLQAAIDDQTVRRQLVAAGQDQLHRFSWSACTEALASLYGRLA